MSKAKKEDEFNKLDDRPAAEVLREDRPHLEGIARDAYKAAQQPKKAVKTFDEMARAARVLASQGRAVRLVEHLSDSQRKRLAACCDEHGVVLPSAPGEFNKVQRELIDEQKASVDGLEPDE